jgi:hypothetical protein
MPSSLILGCSRCPKPIARRANPDVETTDWRARRGRTAQRVRREGTANAVSYPYLTRSFRNSAAFGKRIEYWIIGRMLKEGIDVYVPLVDDHAVDAIIKRQDGSTALIQIKARSKEVVAGDAALFAAIPHDEVRLNYWFVFYSERMDMTWIMSSAEFDGPMLHLLLR